MRVPRSAHRFRLALACLFTLITAAAALAADTASLRGTVVDPLGAVVAGARVDVLRDGAAVKSTTTDAEGKFTIDALAAGRYVVAAAAAGFERRESAAVLLREGGRGVADVMLQIGGLTTDLVVTAAAGTVSSAQVGASVTVLDQAFFDRVGHVQLLDSLRTVPGVSVAQSGQRGGVASLFVRGGSGNFNKVLIDGIPANEMGGSFDFADLSTTGIERLEILRSANSVAYGTDALTGVVDLTTRRGRTRRPEATLSGDIGNLGTSHSDLSVGGTADAFNYFLSAGHFKTDNDTPNAKYRNNTMATRLGGRVGRTDVSGTVRWFDSNAGSPNAILNYGIADDSTADSSATTASVAASTQWTDRWQTVVRFGALTTDDTFTNPSPTGTPSDSSAFANFLGNVVTITSGTGASVTGRAILDYSGAYPSIFNSKGNRQFLLGQTNYQIAPAVNLAGGLRIEREHAETSSSPDSRGTRNNAGGFVEARAALGGRIFVNGGLGFDNNDSFGSATTPRVSAAAYLRRPSSEMLGETKVTFNAGKGIKAPSLSQELSSVFLLIPEATAKTLGIEAIGPERSRTIDAGVEQGLAAGRARVRLNYFDNQFSDIIEYLSKSTLPKLGVPQAAINALAFGAYANSQSLTAKGVELSGDVAVGRFTMTAAYTHLDAKVTASLSSGALFPSENPKFPGVLIGQYAPLVGNRPFRRPANSGSIVAGYTQGRVQLSWAHFFVGKADDSTYLSDAFFGSSMLLPNQDLDPSYQRADIRATVRVHDRVKWYVSLENAFNEEYVAAAGYPGLPRVVRTGVTLSLGGDR